MKKTWIGVYALLVCFAALIAATVSASSILYNAVGCVNPALQANRSRYNELQSNDFFLRWPDERAKNMTEDQKTSFRMALLHNELDEVRYDCIQKILRYGILFVIVITLFAIHWRLARSSANEPQRA